MVHIKMTYKNTSFLNIIIRPKFYIWFFTVDILTKYGHLKNQVWVRRHSSWVYFIIQDWMNIKEIPFSDVIAVKKCGKSNKNRAKRESVLLRKIVTYLVLRDACLIKVNDMFSIERDITYFLVYFLLLFILLQCNRNK